MRVKRLEIQGFKSFKDKTVVHFDHTITGIVGPNGSGKSNIVDAFFWVMGEQSYKHMRGSGSDDLIFNGSSKYQPLGMAEATLVLEAEEGDAKRESLGKEVSITRRVYRDGEGEYFINGVSARLKDIKEFFMDTGVGTKGYSVIEQGQIGKIVNSKPEERRLLIEEAAGIAKYKARKTESLRKMEATQANLSRLGDIIQEIERTLGSLERQAEKARRHKKYKDELLDKEMTWGRRKAQVLKQKHAEVARTREVLEQELAGLKAELQVAENQIEIDRTIHLADTQQAESAGSQLTVLRAQFAQKQSALQLSRSRQLDIQTRIEHNQQEREELVRNIDLEQERIAAQELGSQQAATEFERLSQEARELETAVYELRRDTDDFRRGLESAKRELMQGIQQASDFTSRSAALESRMQSSTASAERARAQVDQARERVASAQADVTRATETLETLRARKGELELEERSKLETLTQGEQSLKALEQEHSTLDRSLNKLKSRAQSLEELLAAFEGFADGPKSALDWARDQGRSDHLRAAASAVQVTSGYEAAVEGWLETRLQSLISDDVDTALAALEHIRQGKQGRAAIQLTADSSVLGTVPTGFAQAREVLSEAGFEVLGELADFVEASEAAARSLVGQVAVVRTFEPLARFVADGKLAALGGWNIVTLDGQALDSGGVLRGGSTEAGDADREAASLLGRKRAIADLHAEIESATARLDAIESSLATLKAETEASRERLLETRNALQDLKIEIATADRDNAQAARSLREQEMQLAQLDREAEEMQEQAAQASLERAEVQERLSVITQRRSELEAQISSQETDLETRDAQTRSQESTLQEARLREVELRERAQGAQRELESARNLIADRKRRLAELERQHQTALQEHEQYSGGDQELETSLAALTQEIHSLEEALRSSRDRVEGANSRINAGLDQIKRLHQVGNEKTTQTNDLAIETERVAAELTHLIQNLEEKYGPGCLERRVTVTGEDGQSVETSPIQDEMADSVEAGGVAIEPVVTAEMTAEEEALLAEEVERLRARLRNLGEVNPMALEEFEEQKKRYDYLIAERGDLEQSMRNLQEAIDHINKTSEERFRKAFTAIADRFDRLFPIIFGGGSASLTLAYPEGSTDILEAGVEIMAQPPGKKVSNITLLSGGEKALTAVALIFAIFMVKPSPFCLLDEVDAPLDDANIGKFNALLKEMSTKSQFILITHNKKTMELNDTLYGVTMEEPGVSKMVSIQMQ